MIMIYRERGRFNRQKDMETFGKRLLDERNREYRAKNNNRYRMFLMIISDDQRIVIIIKEIITIVPISIDVPHIIIIWVVMRIWLKGNNFLFQIVC